MPAWHARAMPRSTNARRITGSSLSRIISLSDGIVAVALTVLVLPLVDIPAPGGGASQFAVITENSEQIAAYVLTFLIVFVLWFGHHRVFENFRAIDERILWLNALWLVTIAFIPWPSRMLDVGTEGQEAEAVWLYCLTLFLNTFVLHCIYAHGRRHPDLLEDPALARARFSISAAFATLFGILTIVSFFAPFAAMTLLWLAIPLQFLMRHRRRHQHGADAAPLPDSSAAS